MLLFIGLAGRSYLLSLSFVVGDGFETAFAPYFLLPIAWAAVVLLFEGGLVARREGQVSFALGAAACTLLLGVEPPGVESQRLWSQISDALASPRWMAGWATLSVFAWAVFRGVERALVRGVWLPLPRGAKSGARR